ncbi:MAG: hypothetical protein RBS40_00485 [Rhodocyclaceae bacterium]|jgi:hypothetical protein|nr:hypothetical protein [Rhodocyclaceae bacterium]
MDAPIPNGTRQVVDGEPRVFYDGYWIKVYDPPADNLDAKKKLIEALTRRLFNHVEHGINIPGSMLEEVRESFEAETDPDRRRVKGAMLAGALFNRATDIFTKLVEIQRMGVEIDLDNSLMQVCGNCLQEALHLGRLVLHRSGEEGIDELWGEPFRAFSIPVEDFYESRYIKIAQTMRDIDRIGEALVINMGSLPLFTGLEASVDQFVVAAKKKCETLRTDTDLLGVWTSFVVSGEHLAAYAPRLAAFPPETLARAAGEGMALLRQGRDLVSYIARARVPMPKSTREYIERLQAYHHAIEDLHATDRAA